MNCPKCGNTINEGELFCGNCGTKVEQIPSVTEQTTITNNNVVPVQNVQPIQQQPMQPQVPVQQQVPVQPVANRYCQRCNLMLYNSEHNCPNCGTETIIIQNNNQDEFGKTLAKVGSSVGGFIKKHKTIVITAVSIIFVLVIGYLLFNKFYDFTKLDWNKDVGDYNVTHTSPTTLNLNVEAYDKEENAISDIKFEVDGGEVEPLGSSVEWKLPAKDGKYTIKAIAPSGKTIKKTVKVIVLDDDKPLGGLLVNQVEDDDNQDNDQDGLLNKEEKEYKTDKNLADTDDDGLTDYAEIKKTKTDPLKKDTDGDGLRDGDEMDLGLDPLKADSKGDGTKDGDRTLTYTVTSKKGVSVNIKGKGNIASTTIDVTKNSTFAEMEGALDLIYHFHTPGKMESATVTIKYDSNYLKKFNVDEKNVTLYYFNNETKKLEAVPTKVDTKKKTITATLDHFSMYILADSKKIDLEIKNKIMFVIDNSVSMYSEQQMIDAGYNSSTGAVGNDTEFKRLSLTNSMVDMFTGNYEFGVAEFSGNYVNLTKFTNNTETIKASVNKMKSKWNSNPNGTNIIQALKSGIAEYSVDKDKHYLILLTDGKNTEGSLSSNKTTIINLAKDKDVKICVIGLGKELDTGDLKEIANQTGCGYYNASDASALEEIYKIIGADINYNLVDTDDDNKTDSMIEADSGFLVNRDGFSFKNFVSNKSDGGHCYGMALFANLYYQKKLPTSLPSFEDSKFYLRYMKTIKWSSNGYDLKGTYFEKQDKNLYDFKITNSALSMILNKIPGDYRDRIEDSTWMIKKEYYDELQKMGVTFKTNDYKGGDKDFTKYQSALLTIDSDPFNSYVSKDEAQVINAIWRFFMLQMHDKSKAFTGSPDSTWEFLNNSLSSGDPVILSFSMNGEAHAINAIRLVRDNDDSNKFKLEVYDNNKPGETRYIEVTRKKYSKWALDYTAWTNEYGYSFKYDIDYDGNFKTIDPSIALPTVK